MSDIQAVLSALDVFARAPDKPSLERANTWLQDFQHSPEAWSASNVLLLSQDTPPAARLFAAQTFRTKVTYDLEQVDVADLLPLRDTLVAALQHYRDGPKTILVQLCLALSALALQLPSWEGVVPSMIESFGRNPATVPTLLEFLTVLPEEVINNTKIPISGSEYRTRATDLLTSNTQQVLELLSMYIQASGVTKKVQSQIFYCLRSWLVAGEILASAVAETPLLGFAFDALGSDELFDAAVDVICDLIHETQEVEENMVVIELIVPRVIGLRPKLSEAKDDSEKMRGYARIFTEAGETYRLLLLQHTETFFPIVEAIGECSAFPDLDVVPITFHFWMRLAQSIGKKLSVSPLFFDAYGSLMAAMIHHLHFPSDPSTMTSQEVDDFRSFRHVMGDTLKDCCFVLGTDKCLAVTYEMITSTLARGSSGSADSVSWQEIEAPLFSMRSMGAEIDPADNTIIPSIMDLMPSLPHHPRVRYAALLVISRYTPWINMHPDYIPFQLQYISAGFEDSDSEVTAAAGQAMKFLCQDCKRHLSSFLPQLHTFLASVGTKLAQDDKIQVYEAIAHIISAMPMEQAAQSLRTFSLDILAQVHALAIKPTSANKQELQEVGNGLENLESMLHVIQSFGDELPTACRNSCEEAWMFFDPFIAKYGSNYDICERTTRVLRHGLQLFGAASLSVMPSVLARLSLSFEETGYSSYLWIIGKIIGRFGNEEEPAIRDAYKGAYERSTAKVALLMQEKSPQETPDVMEDYLRMLLQMVDFTPDIFFESSAYPTAFRVTMAGLTLIHSEIIFASLDLFRIILTHDSLISPSSVIVPPKFTIFAAVIRQVIDKEGFELVGYLLSGVVGDFPEESTSLVVTIFRVLAGLWSAQLLAWLPPVLQQLSTSTVPIIAKTQFLADVTDAINSGQLDKVKHSIIGLHRLSRKVRDRRRGTTLNQ